MGDPVVNEVEAPSRDFGLDSPLVARGAFIPWSIAASVVNAILVLIMLRPSVPDGSANWYSLFRGYFHPDHLSYAGIAANARDGGSIFVEPATETGVS